MSYGYDIILRCTVGRVLKRRYTETFVVQAMLYWINAYTEHTTITARNVWALFDEMVLTTVLPPQTLKMSTVCFCVLSSRLSSDALYGSCTHVITIVRRRRDVSRDSTGFRYEHFVPRETVGEPKSGRLRDERQWKRLAQRENIARATAKLQRSFGGRYERDSCTRTPVLWRRCVDFFR